MSTYLPLPTYINIPTYRNTPVYLFSYQPMSTYHHLPTYLYQSLNIYNPRRPGIGVVIKNACLFNCDQKVSPCSIFQKQQRQNQVPKGSHQAGHHLQMFEKGPEKMRLNFLEFKNAKHNTKKPIVVQQS